jgi:uncharacterized membrane protein YfcA
MPHEFVLEPFTLSILAFVAFLAGFIDAIAGGGGLLTVPALLLAGVPPHLVLGTNKLSSTFGSATAAYTFYRKKLFTPIKWKHGLLATALGAAIGAVGAHYLPAHWLDRLLPLAVFGCGIYLLFGRLPDAPLDADAQIPHRRQWPQGIGLGFYDGLIGPGTGAFWTISTLIMYQIDLVRASGVARTMNFVSNGVALAVFIYLDQVMWTLGLSMGISLMFGAYLGAHTAIAGGAKFIRPLFILVVLALTVRLVWQHWLRQA